VGGGRSAGGSRARRRRQLALERGDADPVAAPRATPLVHDRIGRWQAIAAILLALNLLLIYFCVVR